MQVVKQVSSNGQKVDWTIRVCGDQFTKCYSGVLQFTLPVGIEIVGALESPDSSTIVVPKGYYHNTLDKWIIGTFDAAECQTANFEVLVTDIELADDNGRFIIEATLTTSCIESNTTDNKVTLVIEIVHEDEVADCDSNVVFEVKNKNKAKISLNG